MNSLVAEPQIGQWYGRPDNQDIFQVTGLDERSRTIEIQYFDGTLDEIDADTWTSLPLEFAEPPEQGLDSAEEDEAQEGAQSQAEALIEDPAALEQLSEPGLGDGAP